MVVAEKWQLAILVGFHFVPDGFPCCAEAVDVLTAKDPVAEVTSTGTSLLASDEMARTNKNPKNAFLARRKRTNLKFTTENLQFRSPGGSRARVNRRGRDRPTEKMEGFGKKDRYGLEKRNSRVWK